MSETYTIGYSLLAIMISSLVLLKIHGQQSSNTYYNYSNQTEPVKHKHKHRHKLKKHTDNVVEYKDKYHDYINACWDEIENHHK